MAMLMLGICHWHSAQQQPEFAAGNQRRAAAEPAFKVDGYHVEGNTVLPPEKLDFLTNYTGPAVSLARLREGLGDLQLLYRNLGFPTISVTLPQQRLTNGIVEVKVIEGRLESINVVSNRFFSSNNILRALPSLHDEHSPQYQMAATGTGPRQPESRPPDLPRYLARAWNPATPT